MKIRVEKLPDLCTESLLVLDPVAFHLLPGLFQLWHLGLFLGWAEFHWNFQSLNTKTGFAR